MAVRQSIIDKLSDPERVFKPFPVLTAGELQELDSVWEWEDEFTGLPIFNGQNPNLNWQRHLPFSLVSSSFARTDIGISFHDEMKGYNRVFTIICKGNGKRDLLGHILQADLKKIIVTDQYDGVRVEKANTALLPYDPPPMTSLSYPLQSLRIKVEGTGRRKIISDMITEINMNGARGFTGAGTHQCRSASCSVGQCMTQSREVRWGAGQNQVLRPLKRFRCDANNITYLLHFDACVRMGLWTTYIGETGRGGVGSNSDVHARFCCHLGKLCCGSNASKYPKDLLLLHAIAYSMYALGEPDPDELMRDPFCHFNVIHTPQDRRYTILDGNYATAGHRKLHEKLLIHQFGDLVYDLVTNSGALNHNY